MPELPASAMTETAPGSNVVTRRRQAAGSRKAAKAATKGPKGIPSLGPDDPGPPPAD